MKRILALVLAACMLLSLSGCTRQERLDRERVRRQKNLYSGKADAELPEVLALSDGTTLEPQSLWDRDGVEILLLGLYETDDEYRLALSVRNESKKTMRVGTTGEGSVNGFEIYPQYGGDREVCGSGMDVAFLYFYKSDLPLVVVPGTFTVEMYVEDPDRGTDETFSFTVHTSAGNGRNLSTLSSLPFWNRDGLSLTLLRAVETDSGWTLSMLMENSTNRTIFLYHTDEALSVNGVELGSQYVSCSESVSAGRQEVLTLHLDWSLLKAAGLRQGDALKTVKLDITKQVFDLNQEPEVITLNIVVPSES